MVKVARIIYFSIRLASGLLKKSPQWLVFNRKAAAREDELFPRVEKLPFTIWTVSGSTQTFFGSSPVLGTLAVLTQERHSLCPQRTQIQWQLVNKVPTNAPRETVSLIPKVSEPRAPERQHGDGIIRTNSNSVLPVTLVTCHVWAT